MLSLKECEREQREDDARYFAHYREHYPKRFNTSKVETHGEDADETLSWILAESYQDAAQDFKRFEFVRAAACRYIYGLTS